MTEATSNEPVRRALLIRTALEVLAEAGGPVQRAEVMPRVAERLEFTPYELEPYRENSARPRWDNHLTWASTDMRAVGWIDKTAAGWVITDAGRRALATHTEDGKGLDAEAGQAYRAQYRAHKALAAQPAHVSLLASALELVEAGLWTTNVELAEAIGVDVPTVEVTLHEDAFDASHRVLAPGEPPSGAVLLPSGEMIPARAALEKEGVQFDASGVPNESQRVRAQDLRAYLEDRGLVAQPSRRAWLVRGSSVDGHDLVPVWRQEGFASLRASKLRAVEPGIRRPELKAIVDEDYSQTSYAAKAAKLDEFHAFLSRMQVGDLITTTSQGQLYLGRITGQVECVQSTGGLSNLRRAVDWAPEGYDYGDLASEIKARLQVQYDVVEMTQQLDLLEKLLAVRDAVVEDDEPPAPPVVVRELTLPDATDELAGTLNVDRAWLQECVDLLRDRPQLIFYGPPGTGKTFIAQHLAAHLAGDNVRLVQFHPAYSYEDFFEGYRPLEEGGFKLKPGPLRKTVDAARESPSTAYFLIIDEINRGNLAKIFGELYFLLEYRSQNVDLLYATDDDIGFTLPENVFIIGTMNTADRSIALVDAAMRRRFAFVALHPSELPTSGVLRRWLAASNLDVGIADLLEELNRRIDDPDFKIGPSYFMRKAVHEPGGLERAWRTAILPLLEEHHYGDGTDVSARYGLDAIRARVGVRSASEESGSSGGEPADPA